MLNHGQPTITECAVEGLVSHVLEIDLLVFLLRRIHRGADKAVPARIGERRRLIGRRGGALELLILGAAPGLVGGVLHAVLDIDHIAVGPDGQHLGNTDAVLLPDQRYGQEFCTFGQPILGLLRTIALGVIRRRRILAEQAGLGQIGLAGFITEQLHPR